MGIFGRRKRRTMPVSRHRPTKKSVRKPVSRPAKQKTWREFNKERMSSYMKKYGGHGPAIRKIAKEWKQYKKD